MASQRSFAIRIFTAFVPFIAVLTVLSAMAATADAQNPVPFTNQPLVPDAIAPGGAGFTLTVNGAGFVATSVVNWNGTPRATTFVSSHQLTATILASDIATASTAAVTVVSPSPGGGVSNTQFFSITVAGASASFLSAATYDSGGINPSSVAIADVNGDGKPDIIVANWLGETNGDGTVAVLLNNGNGTFFPPVSYDSGGSAAYSAAVADVNGDGKPDLIVVNSGTPGGGSVGVFVGNGDGTFQPALLYGSGGVSGQSVKVADLNGDGKLDIVAANYFNTFDNASSGSVGVLLGNGDGTFQTAVAYTTGGVGTTEVAIGDLRGDGKLDLVVSDSSYCPQYADGCVGVLLGNGDGTFQPVVIYASGGQYGSVAIADVNGDGIPDVIVTNGPPDAAGYSTVDVLLGNGDGTLQGAVAYDSGGKYAESVAVADVNGDGKPDLTVVNQCVGGSTLCSADGDIGVLGVLLNNGGGTFQPPLTYSTGGASAPYSDAHLAVADVNGDGKPDIVVPNFGSSTVGVVLNTTQSSLIATSTTLTSSLNPSGYRESVTLTATVSSSAGTPPNGEAITFKNGYSVLGTALLTVGTASLTTSTLPVGVHTITAIYPGDAAFAASTSPGLRQVVNSIIRSATATTLASSLNPSIYGQSVTWTATVTTAGSTPPTGEVNFTWGDSIGSATLNASGVATLTKSNLNADSYTLTAVYEGDPNNAGSTSPVLNQVVTEATSSATLTSSPNPSTSGEAVTFTATIKSATVEPTGPVTFALGKTVLGTAQLSGGKAKFISSTLPVGSDVVTATYYGDSNISQSSASVTQTVSGSVIPPVFTMPYNGTLYLLQEGGSASATTEFGLGTTTSNFVPYYTGLPNNPNPAGEVTVGYFAADTVINFGMFTQFGSQSGWAFSTGTDEASIVAFTDTDDSLGMGGSITQQTSSTTWLLHLDDALSYLYDDDDNDVLMQIRVAPSSPQSAQKLGGAKPAR